MHKINEQIYSSILGMCIGIRIGAPIEPTIWSYEEIKRVYGDFDDYVKNYKRFAADDDTNGPFFFIRKLYEDDVNEITAKEIGETWLNFARYGIGMFWWGGDGISTEHTAYNNLFNGIDAPKSGSIEQNGQILAEQIGGQIFIDSWGWIFAGNPEKAAEYAARGASVSHDGEGIEGAKFIAAAIAYAFVNNDIFEVYDHALSYLNPNSLYYKLGCEIREFYENDSEKKWENCLKRIRENWGYDKYPGVCHIIPNAAICFMSLLYGKGDFSETILISVKAGWDTDCNGGNVGSIIGALCNVREIPSKLRNPINDQVIASCFAGSLNIVDIPTISNEIYDIYLKMNTDKEHKVKHGKHFKYTFEHYGSTHGVECSNEFMNIAYNGNIHGRENCLEILVDRMFYRDSSRIYINNFFPRKSFSDERYKPVFSPILNSGQEVIINLSYQSVTPSKITIIPYVMDAFDDSIVKGEPFEITSEFKEMHIKIPEMYGSYPSEIGFLIINNDYVNLRALGTIFIKEIKSAGNANYEIDFLKQRQEFNQITPFSQNLGTHFLFEKGLKYISGKYTESLTGNYYNKDYDISAYIKPDSGFHHYIIFRVKGLRQYLGFGFYGENKVAIFEQTNQKLNIIKEIDFQWQLKQGYEISASINSDKAECFIDGKSILECENITFNNGSIGYGAKENSIGNILHFEVKEKDE